ACLGVLFALGPAPPAHARPAHRKALSDYFGPYLARNLDGCRTCHVSDRPTDEEHSHNPFGARLAAVRDELRKAGKKTDLPARLEAVAGEDSDGDGSPNLVELLSGHHPGDPKDRPSAVEVGEHGKTLAAFTRFQKAYPWKPFEAVRRPEVPKVR